MKDVLPVGYVLACVFLVGVGLLEKEEEEESTLVVDEENARFVPSAINGFDVLID